MSWDKKELIRKKKGDITYMITNAMWNLGLNHGEEKGHKYKNWWNPIKSTV